MQELARFKKYKNYSDCQAFTAAAPTTYFFQPCFIMRLHAHPNKVNDMKTPLSLSSNNTWVGKQGQERNKTKEKPTLYTDSMKRTSDFMYRPSSSIFVTSAVNWGLKLVNRWLYTGSSAWGFPFASLQHGTHTCWDSNLQSFNNESGPLTRRYPSH